MSQSNVTERVVVAILNWNGLHHLQTYLPQVILNCKGDADVAVIDNGSSDESVVWCTQNYPEVQVVRLENNLGFSGGYNAGLAQIQAKTFVLLNSDVRTTNHWIPPVLDMMKSEGYVACQPLILNDSDNELFEYAGAAGGHIDKNGYTFCAGRIFEVFESNHGQYAQNREVFWASGAALFIDSQAFHAVGGLDVDFFAHMEEIDLCWRLKNRGYRVGVCGSSIVYHLGGGTLQKISPFKTYLNFRNNLFLLVKNHHRVALIPMLIERMTLDGVAAFKFLSEGSFHLFLAVAKAHRDFYKSFRKMRNKRKLELAATATDLPTHRSPNYCGWYHRSIIWDYFILKKQIFQDLESDHFEASRD